MSDGGITSFAAETRGPEHLRQRVYSPDLYALLCEGGTARIYLVGSGPKLNPDPAVPLAG